MTEDNMCDQDSVSESSLILSKLAIDRCRDHITHLHALMYTCGYSNQDVSIAESARIIIAGLELDLDCSADALRRLG